MPKLDIKKINPLWQIYILAIFIMLSSYFTILYFANAAAVSNEMSNTMTVFHIILPVFASWIGTIIAFYFGKESFESANAQIREANDQIIEVIKKLTPEEMAKNPIIRIMRKYLFSEIVYYKIPKENGDNDINLQEINDKMISGQVSRLPILNLDDSARYIIHDSRIQTYFLDNYTKKDTATLFDFIEYYKSKNIEFGLNRGFVVVSETASIEEAKQKMEKYTTCQDIFITETGSNKDPIIGWVSNIRLSKYLRG